MRTSQSREPRPEDETMAEPKLGSRTNVVNCRGTAVYFKLAKISGVGLRWIRYESENGRRFKDTGQGYPVGQLVEAVRNHAKLGALEPTLPDDYENRLNSPYSAIKATARAPQTQEDKTWTPRTY